MMESGAVVGIERRYQLHVVPAQSLDERAKVESAEGEVCEWVLA